MIVRGNSAWKQKYLREKVRVGKNELFICVELGYTTRLRVLTCAERYKMGFDLTFLTAMCAVCIPRLYGTYLKRRTRFCPYPLISRT